MDLNKAEKFINKQIEELEKARYMFETVVQPRYEADKQILESIKQQAMKLKALKEKEAKGEEISVEEIYDAVPIQFR